MKIENGQSRKNRSKKLAKLLGFIFVSIIIHMILVIVFFRHGFHKKAMSLLSSLQQELTPEQQHQRTEEIKQKRDTVLASLQALKKEKIDNRPAQLRAPKSNFGWVLFDEPPSNKKIDPPIPLEIPTTLEGSVMQASTDQATENEQDHQPKIVQQAPELADFSPKPIQKMDDTDMLAEKALPESKQPQEQVSEKKPEASVKKTVEPASIEAPTTKFINTKDTPPTEMAKEPAEPKIIHPDGPTAQTEPSVTIKSTNEQTSPQEKITDLKINTDPVITTAHPQQSRPITVRGASSITQKPKRNIIALTKGFIEKIHGSSGTDLIDRDGDPDKCPSLEELKHISYQSELHWCIQASWKQNAYYLSLSRHIPEGFASIQFTLDEHGNLMNCSITQPSGHDELDKLIMRTVKLAIPFPPIPKILGVKRYTTHITIAHEKHHQL